MAKKILKPKLTPVFKPGDVLRNKSTGSIWTIDTATTLELSGMVKRVDREINYPYGYNRDYEKNEPTDWSGLLRDWEFVDDEFTRWVKDVRKETK